MTNGKGLIVYLVVISVLAIISLGITIAIERRGIELAVDIGVLIVILGMILYMGNSTGSDKTVIFESNGTQVHNVDRLKYDGDNRELQITTVSDNVYETKAFVNAVRFKQEVEKISATHRILTSYYKTDDGVIIVKNEMWYSVLHIPFFMVNDTAEIGW